MTEPIKNIASLNSARNLVHNGRTLHFIEMHHCEIYFFAKSLSNYRNLISEKGEFLTWSQWFKCHMGSGTTQEKEQRVYVEHRWH